MARKPKAEPTAVEALNLSEAILTALWRGDYYTSEDGTPLADVFAAASKVVGYPVTSDTLSIHVIAEVSTAVQDAYWATQDDDGGVARKLLAVSAEMERNALLESPDEGSNVPTGPAVAERAVNDLGPESAWARQ